MASKRQAPEATSALFTSPALAELRKRFGAGVLRTASEIPDVPRLRTGCYPLDRALGGGWGVGRIHLLYGKKSSAKTTSALRTLRMAQHTCRVCYRYGASCSCFAPMRAGFIDVEGALERGWASGLGVALDEVLYATPTSAEEAVDINEVLLRSGSVDVVVLDSIAALTPQAELDGASGDWAVGNQPRLVGQAMRKATAVINEYKEKGKMPPTLLLINQVRMKLSPYGNPEVTPGGNAPGFFATSEVRFGGGRYHAKKGDNAPDYADFSFVVEKNKLYTPKHEDEFRMGLAGPALGRVLDGVRVVDDALLYGVVSRKGNGPLVWEKHTFAKQEEMVAWLDENREESLKLQGKVLPLVVKNQGLPPPESPSPGG